MAEQEPQEVILARIDERTKDTNETVKQIQKTVFIGNGTPSLMARMTAMETASTNTRYMIGLSFTVGAFLTGAIALFQKLTVHTP